MSAHVAMNADDLVGRIALVLEEMYHPGGVLIFWSSPISYMQDRRPCDMWREGDTVALKELWDRLEAFADGVFA